MADQKTDLELIAKLRRELYSTLDGLPPVQLGPVRLPATLDADTAAALKEKLTLAESPHTHEAFVSDLRYFITWAAARYPNQGLQLPFAYDLRNPDNVRIYMDALAPEVSPALLVTFLVDHANAEPWKKNSPTACALPPDVDEALVRYGVKQRLGAHKASVLSRRLSMVSRYFSLIAGRSDAENPARHAAVRQVLKICRKVSQGTERSGKAPALTRDRLEQVLGAIDGTEPQALRDRALVLFAFASGGRRRSELTGARGLRIEDLHDRRDLATGRQYLETELVIAKTQRILPVQVHGRAYRAVDAWRHHLALQGITGGALFRRFLVNGKIGKGLSEGGIYAILKQRFGVVGATFSPHSARRGFVTQAGEDGIPLGDVMKATGHKSTATAARYYDEGARKRNRALLMLEDED